MESKKVFDAGSPDEVAASFAEYLPEEGTDLKDLLNKFERDVLGNATLNIGPHFYSYVLSPGNHAGMAGEFLSVLLNSNPAKWHLGAAGAELEKLVIRWIAQFIGYSEETGGILVSGGSMANLTCLNVARNVKSPSNIAEKGLFGTKPMTLYISEQVHYCVDKAASMLGIGKEHVRKIPTNSDYKMNLKELEKAIVRDQEEGLKPFCVVASAGTVNTGTIDDLEGVAAVCQKYDLWFHIDAAYGGPAAGTELVGKEFKGMEKADSLALDPHKWFYVPIEAGCALVRNRDHLRNTFSLIPEYL